MASAAMALAAVLGATGLAPFGVALEQPARVGRGVGTNDEDAARRGASCRPREEALGAARLLLWCKLSRAAV